jgi:sucrose-phosphate synthase
VLKILRREGIPNPDVLITSLGTEISYSRQLIGDIAWREHIDHTWTPEELRRVLRPLPGLKLQPQSEQSIFKVSYYYDPEMALPFEDIQSLLRQQELSVNATLSFGQYLDVIPARASKGQALRYVASQWGIPLNRILVTGGSGGDDDMLRGNTLGVVVANRHSAERRRSRIAASAAAVPAAERTGQPASGLRERSRPGAGGGGDPPLPTAAPPLADR